ncbi:hypothetical protein ACFFWC_25625 [Plantactinospora siamensis]|uniref:Heavy metal-binding domain-containing protein n=1 Tax=Plantactinospora siamensis TaxID=555372 RepID=A0ABV6P5R6_9ACTN
MGNALKLGGATLGLAAVFGAAFGVGRVGGPVAGVTRPVDAAGPGSRVSAQHGTAPAGHDAAGSGHDPAGAGKDAAGSGHDAAGAAHDAAGSGSGSGHDAAGGGHDAAGSGSDPADAVPGGLQVAEGGYALVPVAAAAGQLAFRITGPGGGAVTAYDERHDKRMHLIVVRRDLSGFRHVHPEMSPDGTWRVADPLTAPGSWRAFADFQPTGGSARTLGLDLAVPGAFTPRPLPAPATVSTVDGYTVTLAGTPVAGRTSRLTLTVSRGGRPVTDLQPYLGAYGHLVALRAGDLAYLHVHPDGGPGDGRTAAGPAVTFFAEVPTAGTYRLFLDFRHGGAVHTAEFTVVAGQD